MLVIQPPKLKRLLRRQWEVALDEMYALSDGDSEVKVIHERGHSHASHRNRNNRTSLMVILAGYADKMGTLLRMDPGLDRRFPVRLHLENYSAEQIAKICRLVCRKRFGKSFGDDGNVLEAKPQST